MLTRARALTVIGALVLGTLAAGRSTAAPESPTFGPMIEASASYDGQSRCTPEPKPGVVAFRRRVMAAYPWTGDFGISRACHLGGQSEHKEGRAWDWAVNVSSSRDRAATSNLFRWLFATDRWQNPHARARRLGIMYLIWNRRIWFPYSGWRTYCVQRNRGCVSPLDGDLRHPHTDHVHFSFTWDGALKRTTFWRKNRSFVSALTAPRTGGLVLIGANGGVRVSSAGYFGDLSYDSPKNPVVAAVSRPQGDGYWMVTRTGGAYAFGDAPELRGARGAEAPIADIETTPSGDGYWVVSSKGELFARGDARRFGSITSGARVVDLLSSPTGRGYLMLTSGGGVVAFGDAVDHGDVKATEEKPIAIAAPVDVSGYWILTTSGNVHALGGVPALGGPEQWAGRKIVGLAATPGLGYWVAINTGRVASFGDAAS